MNRLSKDEVSVLLDNATETLEKSNIKLSEIECSAHNYLFDYVELGEIGISSSHEGCRLFNLCVQIIEQYISKQGKLP